MVLALRIRGAKPVNERKVNTQFGQQFDSARLHFFNQLSDRLTSSLSQRVVFPARQNLVSPGGLTQVLSKSLSDFACFNGGEERIG